MNSSPFKVNTLQQQLNLYKMRSESDVWFVICEKWFVICEKKICDLWEEEEAIFLIIEQEKLFARSEKKKRLSGKRIVKQFYRRYDAFLIWNKPVVN